MRNLYYVAIEGTIGVGKTSLANLLCEKLGAKLVLESFEAYPTFMTNLKDMLSKHNYGFYSKDINSNRSFGKLICFKTSLLQIICL